MQHQVEINGKQIAINLSKRASEALSQRSAPLVVEMELYFSCLIRKKVRFHDTERPGEDALRAELSPQLHIQFRPVMTRTCGRDYEGDEPPLTDFPIANPKPYVPHWLRIDFRNGEWQGEFGYASQD